MLLDLIDETKDIDEREVYFKLLKESNDKLTETLHYLNETINIKTNSENLKIPINVKLEVEKVLHTINAIILKENVSVKINIDDDLSMNTVPSYFESIIFNLVSNAVKYKSDIVNPIIEIFKSLSKIHGTNFESMSIPAFFIAPDGLFIIAMIVLMVLDNNAANETKKRFAFFESYLNAKKMPF